MNDPTVVPTVAPPYTGTAPKLTAPPVSLNPPRTAQFHLASPGARLKVLLIDSALFLFTGGIGWLIWSLNTWPRAQTPGGSLMNHVVMDANTGLPLDRGRMAVRELLVKGALGYVFAAVSGGIYYLVDALMIFGDQRTTLHDRMAGSLVRSNQPS